MLRAAGARLSGARVAVIGAGPSGLVTVKELLEEGHEPSCFDAADGIGGAFRFAEQTGRAWESLRLVSSGLLTAFSDFPAGDRRAHHMPAGEYVAYLEEYCDAFGLRERLRLGVAVREVTAAPQRGWLVRTSEGDERFDAVAVCAGLTRRPHLPDVPGRKQFAGQVLHASEYRRPVDVAGRRVLVVGGGESGADIAAEVADHAQETVLSLRRGVAVVPRRRRGRPNDYRISRLNHSAADWIAQTRHPADDWKRRRFRRLFLPVLVFERAARRLMEAGDLLYPGGPSLRTRLAMRRIAAELLAESGGGVLEQFGTKSDDFVRAIAEGRCRRAPELVRLEGGRAVFADGRSFAADVVVFCTGFEGRPPLFADAPRWLHVFDPALGPSVAFVGYARPAHGAIPPLAELQARLFAQVVSGNVALPPEEEMRAAIDRLAAERRRRLRAGGRRAFLVDYTSFCDELASAIGCKPTRAALRGEGLAFRLRFAAGPFVAAQYRLVGPHAKPHVARATIRALPIAIPLPMLAAFALRWAASRAMQRALGDEFAPKLSLERA